MADQGFPRGGGANPQRGGGRQDTILLKFPENCMKLKKIRSRGGRPPRPLRSATDKEVVHIFQNSFWSEKKIENRVYLSFYGQKLSNTY